MNHNLDPMLKEFAMSSALKLRPIPRGLVLKYGSHDSPEDGMCVMECVAYVAGQQHSDSPPCACPVIGAFLRSWNDSLPDDDTRTRLLKPLIRKVVGSKASAAVELARVMLCIDWACREFTPAWLDLVPALKPHAESLRDFKPIQCWDDLDAILSPLRASQKDAAAAWDAARDAARHAARDAAWDAAWHAARDAARDAAWAAAWDAARDAARDAAWDAAWHAARDAARDAAWDAAWHAARDAARDAAWHAAWAAARAAARDAAWAAAWDAARDAAWDALKPTTDRLQQSAVKLIQRMCECK